MNQVAHRIAEINGIQMHLAEQGSGPLVVLCHGFPESWYSWRHQLLALSAAGFHALAPDMRGYGKGAPVAWHAALFRPDRFRAVIGLSVPFRARGLVRPSTVMPQTETALFYQLYFQTPGVAEAELERDPRISLRRILYSASGDSPRGTGGAWEAGPGAGMVDRTTGLLGAMPEPPQLPDWLTDADLDFYAAEFARTGFRGGLNWYRNIDRNWELLAPYAGAKLSVPALYIAGDRDVVVRFPGAEQTLAQLPSAVPHLRKRIMLPGCGHWTQQERATEVNEAMIEFLKGL